MSTLIYAHRGASGITPENTMTAYRKAVELGCDGIECDVQMSKDGRLVICHDETIDRTTNGKGFIKDYTYDELSRFDAGSWFSPEFAGERLPLLDELLELVAKSGILINIELKSGIIQYPNIEALVIDAVKNHGLKDKTIISSFNHYSLYDSKTIDKYIKTGALYMEGLYEPWKYLSTFHCDFAHPFYYAIKPEMIAGYKAANYGVNAFTVDDANIAVKLAHLRIDGIITNYPDKIRDAIASI